MADFVKLAVTAKRLIDKNGRAISIIRLNRGQDDAAKPWRGVADPRATPAATVTGKGVFVEISSASELGFQVSEETGPKRTEKVVIFPANDDGGNDLLIFDEIIDNVERWKILKGQVLQPADTKLIYFFEVAR